VSSSSSSPRRGVLLVILLIVLAVALSGMAMIFLILTTGAAPPIPSNATLYLKVAAPFSEVHAIDPLFVVPPPTLRAMTDAIRHAAKDTRVKTLVILPHTQGALWAQLQEVRDALVEFRKSGKPLTAYLEYGGAQDYFVASAADRVVMMPAGQLDLAGLASYELFFREALDKMGVFPDLLHVGDYKTASNTFTERGFTPAHREMTQSLNEDWYGQLLRAIAEGRKRPEAEVRAIVNNGPFLADDARRAGLVDELAYEDALESAAPIQGTRRLEGDAYVKALLPTLGAPNRIALLYATGTIASGKSSYDGLGGNVVGSETFNQWVRKVRLDSTIRAIVVRSSCWHARSNP
jgi:protease-4